MDHSDPGLSFPEPEPPSAYPSAEDATFLVALKELGELLPRSPHFDWQGSRKRCGEVLRGIIRGSAASQRLIRILQGAPYFVGGDEHHVVQLEEEPDRVFKFTHGDNFGCLSYFSPHDPELTGRHFHGTGNANPFFYLTRWPLLNLIGDYQTRFEGFAPAEKSGMLPRMCISQPRLEGTNPKREHIRSAMLAYGFVEISEDAYLHPPAQVLLTDVAPRNIRILNGIPVPFDAIAQWAPRRIVKWAGFPYLPAEAEEAPIEQGRE